MLNIRSYDFYKKAQLFNDISRKSKSQVSCLVTLEQVTYTLWSVLKNKPYKIRWEGLKCLPAPTALILWGQRSNWD